VFAGIVQEKGVVSKVRRNAQSYRLEVVSKKAGKDLPEGASVAVNGVCLSLVRKDKNLVFDVVLNTYMQTNLKKLRPGDKVNLEEALKAGDTIGGHIVTGHVDGERKIIRNQRTSKGWVIDLEIKPSDRKFVTSKGSISIDGVSLTIGEIGKAFVRIFLIPHTLSNTTLEARRPGDNVNVEFDCMAKYALKAEERFVTGRQPEGSSTGLMGF
jgi:riboflavin synthase